MRCLNDERMEGSKERASTQFPGRCRGSRHAIAGILRRRKQGKWLNVPMHNASTICRPSAGILTVMGLLGVMRRFALATEVAAYR